MPLQNLGFITINSLELGMPPVLDSKLTCNHCVFVYMCLCVYVFESLSIIFAQKGNVFLLSGSTHHLLLAILFC